MALTFLPRHFSQRAQFYFQLEQLLGAGIGLSGALDQLKRHPPNAGYQKPLSHLRLQLDRGCLFAEALESLGTWVPAFDISLLRAGEESGRLEQCLHLLGVYYDDRARTARQVIADLLYPAFLFHFAIFILPFAEAFNTGNWALYLLQTFGVLVPLYALLAAGWYAAQSRHGEKWRALMESVISWVPILGSARRDLALGRLAAALEALLGAGVTIVEAWELAAKASGSVAIQRTVLAWRPRVDAGQTPAEVLADSGRFPEMFANQYQTGEISGRLEDTLGRLHRFYHDQGSRKLHLFAQWTPRAAYLIIVLLIAYRVVSFWANYFNQVGAAAGF
jgi:type II secretory pathway component PulF